MASVVQDFIKNWRTAVEEDDLETMLSLFGDPMTFYSPVLFKPSSERAYIDQIIGFIAEALTDFEYTDIYEQPGGAAMVFTARHRELGVEGIDLFKIDASGKASELKVMIRPLNTAMALAAHMKERFMTDVS